MPHFNLYSVYLKEDPPIRQVYTQPECTRFLSKAGLTLAHKSAINCFSGGRIKVLLPVFRVSARDPSTSEV